MTKSAEILMNVAFHQINEIASQMSEANYPAIFGVLFGSSGINQPVYCFKAHWWIKGNIFRRLFSQKRSQRYLVQIEEKPGYIISQYKISILWNQQWIHSIILNVARKLKVTKKAVQFLVFEIIYVGFEDCKKTLLVK